MAIRIFSKKSFAIGPGAQQGNPEIDAFVTVANAFQDMPDKYKDDPTFKLAVKAGEITIITGATAEKAAEDVAAKPSIDDKPKQTATQAFYEMLKVMNNADTVAVGEKYGVTINDGEKISVFKKRIMEAYKLANPDDEAEQ